MLLNIVLNFYFYIRNSNATLVSRESYCLLGMDLQKLPIANMGAHIHFYAKIAFHIKVPHHKKYIFYICVMYVSAWCKCFEIAYDTASVQ